MEARAPAVEVPPRPRPRAAKRLKRFVRYLFVRLGAAVVALLPARTASSLGHWLGGWAFRLAGGERRKALESLITAFPDLSGEESYELARDCFRHLGRMMLELVCAEQLDRHIADWVEWPEEDRAVLDAALAQKKGVVFVSGHVGSWELLARRVVARRLPLPDHRQGDERPAADRAGGALPRQLAKLKSIWRGQHGRGEGDAARAEAGRDPRAADRPGHRRAVASGCPSSASRRRRRGPPPTSRCAPAPR